jgi:hypothetical protein
MYRDFYLRMVNHLKTRVSDSFPDPILRKNRAFKDLHAGKRCFILGSGNSILEQDLTRLKDEIVMTQNHFHAHKDIRTINPQYHIVVPKYQPAEFDQDWVNWLNSMNERLPDKTVYFFGKNTKYLVDRLSLFKDRAFYIKGGYDCALTRNAPVDITRAIMSVPSALVQCLVIAIYMGFKEIILVGFNLDQICKLHDRTNVRFYGLSPITDNKAEETYESIWAASGQYWINMWLIWRQCNMLRITASNRGIHIINATKGGILDMFERKTYEEVLETI